MSRLKLIGAALLLVIFDMYTASADSRVAQSSPAQFAAVSGLGLEAPELSGGELIR